MKKESPKWIGTVARDLVAIGSVPFFILVLVRVYLLNNPEYFSQFVISGAIFLGAFFLFKQNIYAGLGLIVLVFTSIYYDNAIFTTFGVIAYVLLLAGLFYLKEDVRRILLGILVGVVGIGASLLVLG
jgi:hypothetical protein